MKNKLFYLIIGIIAICSGFSLNILLRIGVEKPEPEKIVEHIVEIIETDIELSEKQLPAIVQDAAGNQYLDYDIPTVESVDGGEVFDESFSQGSYFPTESAQAFKDATLGQCIIEGNYYGAQCVSLAQAFWSNYAGRTFSTCGTGAAKGAWNCKEMNAGDEFDLIFNAQDIEYGDWIISEGGLYGHVGMAVGPYSNGYVALLGENQGGKSCGDGVGGSATNIINYSLKGFKGAFRPKAYHVPLAPESGYYE